jgi:hypothetical protein
VPQRVDVRDVSDGAVIKLATERKHLTNIVLTRIKLGAAVRIPEYALTQYVEERRIDARVAGFAAGVRRRRRARHVGPPDTSRPNA